MGSEASVLPSQPDLQGGCTLGGHHAEYFQSDMLGSDKHLTKSMPRSTHVHAPHAAYYSESVWSCSCRPCTSCRSAAICCSPRASEHCREHRVTGYPLRPAHATMLPPQAHEEVPWCAFSSARSRRSCSASLRSRVAFKQANRENETIKVRRFTHKRLQQTRHVSRG